MDAHAHAIVDLELICDVAHSWIVRVCGECAGLRLYGEGDGGCALCNSRLGIL